jgi:two-component system cell cycle response regulator
MKSPLSRLMPPGQPAVRVLLYAISLGLLAHALHTTTGLGGSGLDSLFNDWVYNTVSVAAAAVCLARGLLVRAERAAWLSIGAGLCSSAAGDVYWTLKLSGLDNLPYPSLADVFYLVTYPALFAGVGLLVRSRLSRFHASLWLDGLIGALAVASVGAAILYPAIRGATDGDAAAIATNLAYPLGDLLLLSFVVGALALTGWRPGRSWIFLGAGLTANAIADGGYLYLEATSGYSEGTALDSLWLFGVLLMVLAAWELRMPTAPARLEGLRMLVMPSSFALAAIGLQVYGQFRPLNGLATGLATATLVAVIIRMVATFRENVRLLAASRGEALSDPLTGLGNRRRLLFDLSAATDGEGVSEPHVFALFDLDGFKDYNDSFGHIAGDALLTRLGQNLAATVQPFGRAYRLGGDEFCVLAPVARIKPESVLAAASAALTEEGEAFNIGNSHGAVSLPNEATDASAALRLADRRMYGQKSRRPRSPERQARSVLLGVLREREPKLGRHLEGVARLAAALGQSLDLHAEELDIVVRAAELHDVGKMAIPDQVLNKPGPLSDIEWDLIRKHTLTGERILAAAPAMTPVSLLVRASHERWDGGGYPDSLAGEEIPLGARIIAICDAFEAMVEERPWRVSRSPEQALAELRRCAGTQFDRDLVELFCKRVYPHFAAMAAFHETDPSGTGAGKFHV